MHQKENQQEGSVGKGMCHQFWLSDLDPQTYGERRETDSWKLSTDVRTHVHTAHMRACVHTHNEEGIN